MIRPGLEQLYPLSPAQHGLLAQELVAPESGHYIVQLVATLHGPVDVDAFRNAWRTAQARHGALRSSFAWESVAEPLQVVHREAPLPFAIERAEGGAWLEAFLRRQRRAAFCLKRAPLFSVTLVQDGDTTHHLVWCYHHLLLDGWSSAIVLREVFSEYTALSEGRPSPLGPPTAYGPYLKWLRAQDQGACERFWRNQLHGLRPARIRSREEASVPATRRLLIPNGLQDEVDACLRAQQITAATLVHGTWAAMLGRRTGSNDVVFGSVVSGRPDGLDGADAIVGLLINVLPVRARLDMDVPVGAWLRDLQGQLREARRFGAIPLGKIASWAGADRAPLFDSILTIENYPDAPWQAATAGAALRVTDVRFVESTDHVLTFEAVPAQRLLMQVLFDERRVHPSGAGHLLEELQEIVASLVAAPDRSLGIALRPSAAPGASAAPREDTLADRWAAAAAAHAGSVAIECGESTATYGELAKRATGLATALKQLGVGPEERVLLVLDRSIDMVAAIIGVLQAGACFVPVDPFTPPERLAFLAADTGARLVVTATPLLHHVAPLACRHILMDARAEAEADAPDAVSRILPDQAAYVIYTSGSTGAPKGVVVTHRNVVRLFDTTAHWFAFRPDDVWTLFHSYAFDFSIWEVFGALLHGGRLVVVPQSVSRSPDDFLCLLGARRVTVLNQTPSAFRLLSPRALDGGVDLSSLRLVIFGGEALPFDALASWCARHGSRPALVNMYGITETTVHVTYRRIDPLDPELVSGSRIGGAIPDLTVRLLDAAGDPVADGEPGEICVSGPGLARGYLGDAALTALRFVPNAAPTRPGERMYRSGDLARRLVNGDLEYLGRIDRQVKSRGFRIEPGEIEAALRRHHAVEDAVVVQRRDGAEPTIAAYVVPAIRAAGPVRRLVSLAAHLPDTRLHELPNGAAVFHQHAAETDMMFDEIFRSTTYLRHGVTIEAGACVFDVGANIGLFSLHAHLAARGVTVYAFEPIAEVRRFLEHNFLAHGIAGRTFDVALGAIEGDDQFAYFPHVSVVSGRRVDAATPHAVVREYLRRTHDDTLDQQVLDELLTSRLVSRSVSCRVQRLSDVLRTLPVDQIDLLKVDVEGGEEEVLEGIDAADWPRIRQVVLEVHDAERRVRIEALLAQRGFSTMVEQQAPLRDTPLWMLYAIARTAAPRVPAAAASAGHDEWRSPALFVGDLRSHLAARLPGYMLPHSIALIDRVPLTPNGKIDESALEAPRPVAPPDHAGGPLTDDEQALSVIWKDLLGLAAAGPRANFFELGGDSIVAVQMVSRARRAGLAITPAQVFEHPTIAGLAAVARRASASPAATHRPRSGTVPLTPIGHWFFEQGVPNRDHWNQAVLFELRDPLPLAALDTGLQAVMAAHDVFALRFEPRDDGWVQAYAPVAEPAHEAMRTYEAGREAEVADQLHRSLSLALGPLLRCAYFAGATGRPARLLLVAHHLVIDAVSWRIVAEDLLTAAGDAAQRRAVRLAAPTASFREWAEWLAGLAGDERLDADAAGYFAALSAPTVPLPRDGPATRGTEDSTVELAASLSAEETAALAERIARPSRTNVGDVVLAAAAHTLARWAGDARVRVDVESHGRPSGAGIDTSRSVGWFTSLFPVVLAVGETPDLRSLLQAVKETLAQAPRHGLSYGVLRYLSPPGVRQKWAALPAAEVSFNFLGDVGGAAGGAHPIRLVNAAVGARHDPSAIRTHAIGIEAAVANGRLEMTWSYSSAVHRSRTIERLAANTTAVLRRMLAQATHTNPVLVSPHDFPLADLTRDELDVVLAAQPRAEDIYPLSPPQQGMLFHALYDPAATTYFSQFHWTFHGDLDLEAFRRSWHFVIQRHAALRTAFVYRGLREPHQVVCADVPLPVECLDWRADADGAGPRWASFLKRERERPFDMSRAPLMRLALAQTGDRAYRFVWNHHHILFDGWCTGLILADLFAAYQAFTGGAPLPAPLLEPARPYRDYVAWLAQQDLAAAEAFWRRQLRDLEPPAPLFATARRDGALEEGALAIRSLDPQSDRRLRELGRAHNLTVNTLLMGAWAIVLSRLTGSREVIFGSTSSGRPPELDGADRMVGLFINTLPVRVDVTPGAPLVAWLTALQRAQVEARRFEHVSLAQVQRWAGAAAGAPFVETAVVFENLPAFSLQRQSLRGLQVAEIGSFVRNHFALTIRAIPATPLRLEGLFDSHRLALADVAEIVGDLEAVLDQIGRLPGGSVGDVRATPARRPAASALGG